MKPHVLGSLLLLCGVVGCQYDERCGKDDLVYARGLCTVPDAAVPAPMPQEEGGASGGDPGDGGEGPSPCEGACELIGRCIAENPMAGGFLADQLTTLGFVGSERAGCVKYCDQNRGGAGDEAVLTCLDKAEMTAMCDSSQLAGSLPSVSAMDMCCEGRADSEYCVAVCTALSTNPQAYGLVASCKAIAP